MSLGAVCGAFFFRRTTSPTNQRPYSQHELLKGNIVLSRALQLHAKELQLSNKKDDREHGASIHMAEEEWAETIEFEAVLDVARKQIIVVQCERKQTAGCGTYLTRSMSAE